MPKLVSEGPDIPNRLLEMQSKGELVFFCGAGVSMPLGLPSFKGLVEDIFEELSEAMTTTEKFLHEKSQFDSVLGSLEQRCVGGKTMVRKALRERLLNVKSRSKKALTTHISLLELATTLHGNTKLVTTNFDRLFQIAAQKIKLDLPKYEAPFLPTPETDNWGVVYLHGFLEKDISDEQLRRIVVTSRDFGRAYLTERWASRFVTELLRRYSVCFVGYSVDDPMLRYLTDAFASDFTDTSRYKELFILLGRNENWTLEDQAGIEAKNLTPIFYENSDNHSKLHSTIQAWAELYISGHMGKAKFAETCLSKEPLGSFDDNVQKLLWAIQEPEAARVLASVEPPPSLKWLEVIEPRFLETEPLCSSSNRFMKGLSPSVNYIGAWLAKHLEEPDLILWAAQKGGVLHPDFSDHLLGLIGTKAESRILILWDLMTQGYFRQPEMSWTLQNWLDQLERKQSLPVGQKLRFKSCLTPRIALRRRTQVELEVFGLDDKDSLEIEVKLRSQSLLSFYERTKASSTFQNNLPQLIEPLVSCLKEYLELKGLEVIGSTARTSHIHIPSISTHPQNRSYQDWVYLVFWIRDGWVQFHESNPARALQAVRGWWYSSYNILKRLALYCVTEIPVVSSEECLEWLLEDNSWALNASECQRETCQLLTRLSSRLDDRQLKRVVDEILSYSLEDATDLEPPTKRAYEARHQCLRLLRLQNEENVLPEGASNRLRDFQPHLEALSQERAEFSIWSESSAGWTEPSELDVPKSLAETSSWIKSKVSNPRDLIYGWQAICKNSLEIAAAFLSTEGKNYSEDTLVALWRSVLDQSAQESTLSRSCQLLPTILMATDIKVLKRIANPLGHWLEQGSRNNEFDPEALLSLFDLILLINNDTFDKEHSDIVFAASCHPCGRAVLALIYHLANSKPKASSTIPKSIRERFQKLLTFNQDFFMPGRILLYCESSWLFHIDPAWTEDFLLPSFSWKKNKGEAANAWAALSKVSQSLKELLKPSLLDTAKNLVSLSPSAKLHVSCLLAAIFIREVSIAQKGDRLFTVAEMRETVSHLSLEGLEQIASMLVREIEGSTDSDRCWDTILLEFLTKIWPKDSKKANSQIGVSFAWICLSTSVSFPAACDTLAPWLRLVESPGTIIFDLSQKTLLEEYPEKCLSFLDLICSKVDTKIYQLKACLTRLKT